MFVENTSIPNLKILYYESEREAAEEEEIISAIASSYRTLISAKLFVEFASSVSIFKIADCCRDLETICFGDTGGGVELMRSDMLAVASLPRLKCLDISACYVADDASSALVRCRGLKELRIDDLVDPSILATIGSNLVTLDLWSPSKEVVDGIIEHCPNLQYLELEVGGIEKELKEVLVDSIKYGLKKLAKFKVNGESIRLGTDWEGY
jgi:hypothetical protein